MEGRGSFTIPAAHPALAGHFPGNPIVPGVLLLAEVIGMLAPLEAIGVPQAKFVALLRPDEACDVRWKRRDGRVDFECAVGARVVARGALAIK